MARFRGTRPLLALAYASLSACGHEPPPAEGAPSAALGELTAVEVTTVTTVQGSSGIFLSPRPQQVRPAYVEAGEGSAIAAEPSAELARAKVDTALLFRGARSVRFDVLLGELSPEHYFPAVFGARWPIALGAPLADASAPVWSEWEGWRAYAGRSVERAPAATLDFEQLGLESPVVLASAGGEEISLTNRGDESIAKALLVYSHAGGIGINVVTDLGPGMRKVTTPGPKEGPPTYLLDKARGELEAFFSESAGAELGRAMAQAKSVPLLETPGLRLLYLRGEAHAPRVVTLPGGFAAQRRFVIGQAEVLLPAEEQHVVSVLKGGLEPTRVVEALGRFSRAKLELAALSDDAEVKARAAALLQTLSE